MFPYLESLGLKTPRHGMPTVAEALVVEWNDNLTIPTVPLGNLVVYLDEHAHSGEGKILTDIPDALRSHSDTVAST